MTNQEHDKQKREVLESIEIQEELKVAPLGGAAIARVAQGEDWPGKIHRSEGRPYFA